MKSLGACLHMYHQAFVDMVKDCRIKLCSFRHEFEDDGDSLEDGYENVTENVTSKQNQ